MGIPTMEPVASSPLSPRMRRQRSLASAVSARCCGSLNTGRNSLSSYDLDDLFPQFPSNNAAGGFLQRRLQKQASAWQESSSRLLGSRRFRASRRGLVFCNGGVAYAQAEEAEDEVYYKPSPWKIFLRKLRAETKKMNCVRPAPAGFQYDAFSYAMNFDDGGWQPPQQYFQSLSSESSSSKLYSK